MRVILLILFILLIAELVVFAFFLKKRIAKYDHRFVRKLHDKMIEYVHYPYPNIFNEFEKLFVKYSELESENQNFGEVFGEVLISILYYCAFAAFILLGVLLQTCRDCLKVCRGVFSLIFLTICFGSMVTYLVESIMTKYKVNLSDSQIYMYDSEFNKEIKEKLNMMFERKIYMLVFSIFLTLSAITQITLIIIDIILFKKKKNIMNNINNTQPQIAANQESERKFNHQNNGNADIQVHIRQNIANTEEVPVKNN